MNKNQHFFFFGDSISFGQFVSPHKTWVTMLSQDLEQLLKPTSLSIMNVSISGNTTRMALERMPYDVQAHGIDYIVIEFGMNDCNCWEDHNGLPRVSEYAFEANLREIIERSKKFGAKKVFLIANHPTTRVEIWPFNGKSYQQNNERYNAIIRTVAEKEQIILIDVENAWRQNKNIMQNLADYLMPDQVHLSEIGHQVYYEVVKPIVLSNVRKTSVNSFVLSETCE